MRSSDFVWFKKKNSSWNWKAMMLQYSPTQYWFTGCVLNWSFLTHFDSISTAVNLWPLQQHHRLDSLAFLGKVAGLYQSGYFSAYCQWVTSFSVKVLSQTQCVRPIGNSFFVILFCESFYHRAVLSHSACFAVPFLPIVVWESFGWSHLFWCRAVLSVFFVIKLSCP